MKLLESIETPADVKSLSQNQLADLCQEIRDFLILNISHTGGHLAANLGVVELTVALLRCFDMPKDKLIWDVGHQSYVYKILTGRRDRFSTLRSFHGLCGFPRPAESEYDSFATGHSSTSISAALGMSKAMELSGNPNYTIAVIGDGALTGGLAYEGLNNAGKSAKRLIVIINDNELSISKNVGSVADYLSTLTSKPRYFRVKRSIKKFVTHIPIAGKPIYNMVHHVKKVAKRTFSNGTFFEQLGFNYYGPVDGHDEDILEHLMRRAKEDDRPVVIHIKTKKGKGYRFAEDSPEKYHGISGFNIDNGKALTKDGESFSHVFGEALCEMAAEHPEICAITAAMCQGVGLSRFSKEYPSRFFDVGIAEQHAITFSAGLAKEGRKPFAAIYSSFLQRAYDQILHDVCLQHLPVTLCIDRAGLVGEDGDTHQGIFDMPMLLAAPGITVYSPATYKELRIAMREAYEINGPVAIRYPRGGEGAITSSINGSYLYTGPENPELLFVTYGRIGAECEKAAYRQTELGKKIGVFRYIKVKPFDIHPIKPLLKMAKRVIFVEESILGAGLADQFGAILAAEKESAEFAKIGFEHFVSHGSMNCLFDLCKMDAAHLEEIITGEKA